MTPVFVLTPGVPITSHQNSGGGIGFVCVKNPPGGKYRREAMQEGGQFSKTPLPLWNSGRFRKNFAN